VLLRLDRFDEAQPLLLRALEVSPGQPRALRGLARIARARGEPDRAVELLEAAIAAAPQEASLRFDHADALRAIGRLEAAEAAYRAAGSLVPGDHRVSHGLAVVARARGRAAPSNALTVQDTLAAALPTRESGAASVVLNETARRRDAAHAAEREGDFAAALAVLDGAAVADPNNLGVVLDRARVLVALGRTEQAEAAFLQALAKDPRQPRAVLGLARLEAARGDTEAAIIRLQAAVAAATTDVRIALELGNLLAASRRSEEAAAAYDSALRIAPQDTRPLLALSGLALAQGDLAMALVRLRVAAAAPHAAEFVLQIGRGLIEAGAPDEAVALAEGATATAALALARVARQHHHREAAANLLRIAVAAAPGDRTNLIAVATEWQELNHTGTALELLEGVIRDGPDDAAAWLKLGTLRRRTDASNNDEALRCFLRAVELDPTNAEALAEAAREQLSRGRFAASESLLRRALAIDPRLHTTLRLVLQLLKINGEFETALRFCERLRKEEQDAGWILEESLDLETRLGNWRQALNVLDEMEAGKGPRASIAASRARIFERFGDITTAARLLTDARQAWPNDSRLWWQQVDLHVKHGPLVTAASLLNDPPNFVDRGSAQFVAMRGRLADAEWRIEDAVELYATSLDLNPNDQSVQDRQIRMMLFMNDAESALRILRDQLRLRAASERLAGRKARASRGVLGRLTNEYRLDADLIRALRTADALPLNERLPRQAQIARDAPNHTAPAIAVLLTMRRLGLLRAAATTSSSGEAPALIPWRITQFWDTPDLPQDVSDLMETWRTLNPGFAYARFDAFAARSYLIANFPPPVVRAFGRAGDVAQKADIFRLAVLLREGGFYADADDRCVRPLVGLLGPGVSCLVYQEEMGTIANNFMGVVPGHPLVAMALGVAVGATNRGDQSSPWLDTGPALLSRCFVSQAVGSKGEAKDFAARFSVPSHTELREFVSIHCSAGYKRTPLNWQIGASVLPRARLADDLRQLLGMLPAEGDGHDAAWRCT
jgi:tetratricopeptide (TPR) repeat protein